MHGARRRRTHAGPRKPMDVRCSSQVGWLERGQQRRKWQDGWVLFVLDKQRSWDSRICRLKREEKKKKKTETPRQRNLKLGKCAMADSGWQLVPFRSQLFHGPGFPLVMMGGAHLVVAPTACLLGRPATPLAAGLICALPGLSTRRRISGPTAT
jgi:hypothetical protein